MKKHDEGYVLAYVTVVLLVFCLVATTILTGALRNLQNQQDANDQMKDQYLAAGEIEKVLAALDSFVKNSGNQEFTCGKTVEISWDDSVDETTKQPANVLTITARSGSVVVTCKLKLIGTGLSVSKTEQDMGEDLGKETTVAISGLTGYEHESYQIGGASE